MCSQIRLEDRHQEHRRQVRAFCESELDPHVEAAAERREFPTELVNRIGEAGYYAVSLPAGYGGGGGGYREFAITVEELARSWKVPAGAVSLAGGLVGYMLQEFGAEWQREEWLRDICTEYHTVALALTEDEAGSDAGQVSTTARRDGDDLLIDGRKVWSTNASVADILIAVVRTGDPDSGTDGLSLVGIPDPESVEGLTFERDIPCMEGPAAIESVIEFDEVRVPSENVVGTQGEGFAYVMEALDIGRIGTAAQGVGLAQAAFEASRDFADEREQFGRPIRSFQGISFKLADMKSEIEAARLLTLQAATKRDDGLLVTQDAAMAKTYATDVAMETTTEAVQIHGSRGYATENALERYMREAKGTQIYEGTNEVNRVVISRELYE